MQLSVTLQCAHTYLTVLEENANNLNSLSIDVI